MAEAASLKVAVAQRFGGTFAIDAELEVELRPGSVLVLFGPSGAGKTTILRYIAGLDRPDAGVIRFGGEVWCDTARERLASTAGAPHRPRVPGTEAVPAPHRPRQHFVRGQIRV